MVEHEAVSLDALPHRVRSRFKQCYEKRAIFHEATTSIEERVEQQESYDAAREEALAQWPQWRRTLNQFVRKSFVFEVAIFAVIVLNSLTISLDNFTLNDTYVETLSIAEDCFTVIFFGEMVLKLLGRGALTDPGGYFRTKVNLFDFSLVVVTTYGLFQKRFFPQVADGNFTVVIATTGRLLRPIRALHAFDGIRSLLQALVVALRRLADVGLLATTFSLAMGVCAMTFFGGSFGDHCFRPSAGGRWTQVTYPGRDRVCAAGMPYHSRNMTAPLLSPSMTGFVCPFGQYCRKADNPERGYVGFDTIMTTFATLFSVMTLEAWTDVMYYAMDAKGNTSSLFFVLAVMVGSMFLLNLVLAILTDSFTRSLSAIKERKATVHQSAPQPRCLERWCRLSVGARAVLDRAQQGCHTATTSRIFFWLTVAVAVSVSVVLALPTDDVATLSLIFQSVGCSFFGMEMLARFVSQPGSAFLKDRMNIFDTAVTVCATLQLAITGDAPIAAFRLTVLLRATESLRHMVRVLSCSLPSTLSNLFLVLVANFLLALLGVQLFGGKMCDMDSQSVYRVNTTVCDNVPRGNYDNVAFAMVSTFVNFVGNGWRQIMTTAMKATNEFASVYFCGCLLVGGYLFLSLFVAVLIHTVQSQGGLIRNSAATETEAAESELDAPLLQREEEREVEMRPLDDFEPAADAKQDDQPHPQLSFLSRFVKSSVFDAVIAGCIALSCISQAVVTPRTVPDSTISLLSTGIDVVTALMFLVEAILKIWQRGIRAYFTNAWNIFDFVLMILALLSVIVSFIPLRTARVVAKWLSVSRIFRPWSVVGRNQTLALVFLTVTTSLKAMGNVAIVAIMFWSVSSVLGFHLFSGELGACTSVTWGDQSFGGALLQTKEECLAAHYRWASFPKNFDTFFEAMITLFGVATKDNWKQVLFMTSSVVGPNERPLANSVPWLALFGMIYTLAMTFFMLNIIISVLVDAYFQTKTVVERQRREAAGLFMSPAALDYVDLFTRALLVLRPTHVAPYERSSWRRHVRSFIRSAHTEKLIFGLGFLVVSLQLFDRQFGWDAAVAWASLSADLLLLCLTVAIPIGVGFKHAATTPLTVAELCVNSLCLIASTLQTSDPSNWTFKVLGLVRVVRLLRICWLTAVTRLFFSMVWRSLGSFLGLLFLLFILFFNYGVIGMQVFGTLQRGVGLTALSNFERLDLALLTLFRAATFDNWQVVMWDCSVAAPLCDDNIAGCGNVVVARVFFLTFLVLSQLVGFNCFTAVLLNSFALSERDERFSIQEPHMKEFRSLWKECSGRSSLMTVGQLLDFLEQLPPPLGLKNTTVDTARFLQTLPGGATGNFVSQPQVFVALVERFFAPAELPASKKRDLSRNAERALGSGTGIIIGEKCTFFDLGRVVKLQRWFRKTPRTL